MLIFGLTIVLGAFLLFQVELILGKCILPWFGGASTVWITCLLFFQLALLGGYLYSHVLARVRARTQALIHYLLLLTSLSVLLCQVRFWHLPVIPDSSWKPHAADIPFWQVLKLLAVSVGVPFLALASSAPLLQSWWHRLYPQRSPYRLYAVSNLGSFLGLISYPFVVEPFFHLKTQAHVWSCTYLIFSIGCGYCAFLIGKTSEPTVESASAESQSSSPASGQSHGAALIALWLGLAAVASAMFLATTNQLCKNVAPVPLLWVLPLAVYLLSFMLCFESEGRYSRRWFHPAFALSILAACFVLASESVREHLLAQIVAYSLILFVVCMVCHGELARLKPDPSRLTLFYISVASGGAIGGFFVALLAPSLFGRYWEYQISLCASALLLFVVLARERNSWLHRLRAKALLLLLGVACLIPESAALATDWKTVAATWPPLIVIVIALLLLFAKKEPKSGGNRTWLVFAGCGMVLLMLGATLVTLGRAPSGEVAAVRNFYGALTVKRQHPGDPQLDAYALEYGEVLHGFEFSAPERQLIPTSYYAKDSGLGLLFERCFHIGASPCGIPSSNLRIGVIGLGVGTTAAYAQSGDYVRFYEINPAVVQFASDKRYFHYLAKTPANHDVVVGDARLSLENELKQGSPQNFDLFVVDAFSGDAIPVHLLTEEAFRVYFRHLKGPHSVLAVHVTNSLLNLRPVVVAAGQTLGAANVWVHTDGDGSVSTTSDWVLLSRDQRVIESIARNRPDARKLSASKRYLWTDDYSNLLQVLAR